LRVAWHAEPCTYACGQELRGIGLGGYEVPEWKTKALGKAPTFGFSDVRPIKEQRESLPIFKLRDQLIEAITAHQARAHILLAHISQTYS
jgi:ATP-dependent RNA helicase DHX8/PRP22